MEYKQAEILRGYIEHLQAEAFERGFKVGMVRTHGHWLWSPRDIDGTVSGCCSKCSFSHIFVGGHTAQYRYCPYCGAKMDEEVQDE